MTSLPTVLVVDDEPRSIESLQRILEDCFDVKGAASVEKAEEILEREWVQVILCDQRMPHVSGVEFLKSVRERWPEVVRMIISGYTDAEDIIRSINEAGIYQYVMKPWQPEGLILTLKNAVHLFELQRQNELPGRRAENVVAAGRKRDRDAPSRIEAALSARRRHHSLLR